MVFLEIIYQDLNNMSTFPLTRSPRENITCNCDYTPFDIPVQSNLALTPAKVKELTDKGIAVSTPVSSALDYDGSSRPGDFTLDPMYANGSDRNTLWEMSQTARQRILKARSRKPLSPDAKDKPNI